MSPAGSTELLDHMDKRIYGHTKSAKPIDDDLIEMLAREAEAGYGIDEVIARRAGAVGRVSARHQPRSSRCGSIRMRVVRRRGTMPERLSWDEAKALRGDTPERRLGYQKAKDAFELAGRVRAEREGLGLTQAELAERMGTSQPVVAQLEAGGIMPSLDTLYRAADALGVELIVSFQQRSSARREVP